MVEDVTVVRVAPSVVEDGDVRQPLIDPGQLARIGVVHEQVLEFVGDDALVDGVRPADAIRPVERVGDDHVHAVLVDEAGGEVAGGVRVRVAVVEEVVENVIGQDDKRVTRGI